jgi:hypothetical protein
MFVMSVNLTNQDPKKGHQKNLMLFPHNYTNCKILVEQIYANKHYDITFR